jgi:hypothetical protein
MKTAPTLKKGYRKRSFLTCLNTCRRGLWFWAPSDVPDCRRPFLGNTAEQVIDHLRCDLLVLKPEQYKTPVEMDDEDDD